jgi:hypothetical protein
MPGCLPHQEAFLSLSLRGTLIRTVERFGHFTAAAENWITDPAGETREDPGRFAKGSLGMPRPTLAEQDDWLGICGDRYRGPFW